MAYIVSPLPMIRGCRLRRPAAHKPLNRTCPIVASASRVRGPTSPTPDYSSIDAQPQNRLFLRLFSARLAEELGVPIPDDAAEYATVMRLVQALKARAGPNSEHLTVAAVRVLDSLFPAWLPPSFSAIFSKPLPGFAAWMNAVVTIFTTQWLMGPSHMAPDGSMTVEIERCRYLEGSNCVGICLNSCKRATETFFVSSMGLPVYIEPNFDDFSCKFHFGETPPPEEDQPCFREPCFVSCPSKSLHSSGSANSMESCATVQLQDPNLTGNMPLEKK